jgi:hypothetical protein
MTQTISAEMNRLVRIIESAMTQSIAPLLAPLAREQRMSGEEVLIAMSMAATNNAVSLLSAAVGAEVEDGRHLQQLLRSVIVAWLAKYNNEQPDDHTEA